MGPNLPKATANGQAFTYDGAVYALNANALLWKLQGSNNNWEKKPKLAGVKLREVFPPLIIGNSVVL